MITTQQELGRRIAQARLAAGFTQGDLASKLSVDRTAISKIESGDRRVDTFELARIAEAFRRPVVWFLASPLPSIVSRRKGRDGAEMAADVELELLATDVAQLVDMGLLTPAEAPGFRVQVDSVETAEEAARLVRARLGDESGPIMDLLSAFERLGLYAFVTPLEPRVEGSYVSLERCGVALVQGNDPSGKRRFTLAHELGHHVLQDEYSTEWIPGERDEQERLISAFAIHLLLPRSGLVSRWHTLAGDEDPRNAAIHLAADYAVSWSALCAQLANLHLVDREAHAELARRPPAALEFLERELFIKEEPPSPALSPGFVVAVARGYQRRLLGRNRTLELLRGTVDENELPPQHEVPLDSMIRECEPL